MKCNSRQGCFAVLRVYQLKYLNSEPGTFAKFIPMVNNKIIQKCIVELFIVLANNKCLLIYHNFMVSQANVE